MPTAWSSVQLGGGLSLGGPQAGVALEVHHAVSEGALLGLMAAVSRETTVQNAPFLSFSRDYRQTWPSSWLYLGVQGRKRHADIFYLRAEIGAGVPIEHGSATCHFDDDAGRGDRSACARRDFDGELTGFFSVAFEAELF